MRFFTLFRFAPAMLVTIAACSPKGENSDASSTNSANGKVTNGTTQTSAVVPSSTTSGVFVDANGNKFQLAIAIKEASTLALQGQAGEYRPEQPSTGGHGSAQDQAPTSRDTSSDAEGEGEVSDLSFCGPNTQIVSGRNNSESFNYDPQMPLGLSVNGRDNTIAIYIAAIAVVEEQGNNESPSGLALQDSETNNAETEDAETMTAKIALICLDLSGSGSRADVTIEGVNTKLTVKLSGATAGTNVAVAAGAKAEIEYVSAGTANKADGPRLTVSGEGEYNCPPDSGIVCPDKATTAE